MPTMANVPVGEIRAKLHKALSEASALRAALEARTGLTFKISRDLKLIVDLERR